MNAETPNPQPGDKVRFYGHAHRGQEGTWVRDGLVILGGTPVQNPFEFEVLERADDPIKDLVGTVRRSPNGALAIRGEPKEDSQRYGRGLTGTPWDFDEVEGWEVIGAVPGTPAAEAAEQWRHCDTCECIHPPCGYVMGSQGCDSVCDQTAARRSVRVPNEPHGLPEHIRRRLIELASAGNIDHAVAYLTECTYLTDDGARAYVEGMSAYQAHLAARGERRGSRVFLADGPEPPADVELLRFFGTPARINGLFLRRSVDLQLRWVWLADPEADVSGMVGDTNWPVPNVKGTFTEEVV